MAQPVAGISHGCCCRFPRTGLAVVFVCRSSRRLPRSSGRLSLLLRDVDGYTLAVGMRQYLNPQNYLWGDFAAAVLSAIPITYWCSCWRNVGWTNGLTAGGVKRLSLSKYLPRSSGNATTLNYVIPLMVVFWHNMLRALSRYRRWLICA